MRYPDRKDSTQRIFRFVAEFQRRPTGKEQLARLLNLDVHFPQLIRASIRRYRWDRKRRSPSPLSEDEMSASGPGREAGLRFPDGGGMPAVRFPAS